MQKMKKIEKQKKGVLSFGTNGSQTALSRFKVNVVNKSFLFPDRLVDKLSKFQELVKMFSR